MQVQKRVDDPLVCQDGLKAQWMVALYDAQYKIQKGIKNIQIPFLTLHGTKDKVVDIASSYYLMENAQSKDKTLKVHGIHSIKIHCIFVLIPIMSCDIL